MIDRPTYVDDVRTNRGREFGGSKRQLGNPGRSLRVSCQLAAVTSAEHGLCLPEVTGNWPYHTVTVMNSALVEPRLEHDKQHRRLLVSDNGRFQLTGLAPVS